MPNIFSNGIQIEYETFGESSSPALMLIAGIGGQMIGWDEEICEEWAKKGLYVIRFDNRDVGLSTKMEESGVPDLKVAMTAIANGEKVNAPYALDDMADDAVGLLGELKIDKAHICGISMGGLSRKRYRSDILPESGAWPRFMLPQGIRSFRSRSRRS